MLAREINSTLMRLLRDAEHANRNVRLPCNNTPTCTDDHTRTFKYYENLNILILNIPAPMKSQPNTRQRTNNQHTKRDVTYTIPSYINLTGEHGQFRMQHIGTGLHSGHGYNTGGHYVAHIKHRDTWYEADDSQITPISEERASTVTSAHIVLYAHVDQTMDH